MSRAYLLFAGFIGGAAAAALFTAIAVVLYRTYRQQYPTH